MTGIVDLVGTDHIFNFVGCILFKLFSKIDIFCDDVQAFSWKIIDKQLNKIPMHLNIKGV